MSTVGNWSNTVARMTPEALAELESAIRFGERLAYFTAWEKGASQAGPVQYRLGYAKGQADLAVHLADSIREEIGRYAMQLARDLGSSPTFAELCERRGEPEKAERARQIIRDMDRRAA